MYTLFYHPLVVRDDTPRLSREWRVRIKSAIEEKLTDAPEHFGKPLRRSLKGFRALRVADYRVVFRIERRSVKIFAILHRSVAYERAPRRAR